MSISIGTKLGVQISNGIVIGPGVGVQIGGAQSAPWYERDTDLANSLVAYWKLDEVSGNRADSVGSNTLTDNNTVGSAPGVVHDLQADFVAANSEYLSCASNATLQVGDYDFWMATWVNLDSTAAQQFMGKDATAARDYGLGWALTSTGRFEWIVFDTTAAFARAIVTLTLSTGADYFLLATYTHATKTLALYVNNGTAGTATLAGNVNASASEFQIGARAIPGRAFMDGRLGAGMLGKNYIPTANDRTFLYNQGL